MKNRIIFLDYDGVVNTIWFQDVNGEPNFNFPNLEQVNNTQAIGWLNLIYRDIYKYKIVVTSTWRTRPDYKECLYRAGLNPDIEIIGRTPKSKLGNGQRGWDIQEWLFDNQDNYNIEDYIILDDDSDMVHLSSHLIQTDSYVGISCHEFEKICKRWEKRNE